MHSGVRYGSAVARARLGRCRSPVAPFVALCGRGAARTFLARAPFRLRALVLRCYCLSCRGGRMLGALARGHGRGARRAHRFPPPLSLSLPCLVCMSRMQV